MSVTFLETVPGFLLVPSTTVRSHADGTKELGAAAAGPSGVACRAVPSGRTRPTVLVGS